MREILQEERFIWEAYEFRCVWCNISSADCLHECPPKSLNPKWEEQPENRFPVCNPCHNEAHNISWKTAKTRLEQSREFNFPQALERINEWKNKQLSVEL